MDDKRFYIIISPGPGMVLKRGAYVCEACFARIWTDVYDYESEPVGQCADDDVCDQCGERLDSNPPAPLP